MARRRARLTALALGLAVTELLVRAVLLLPAVARAPEDACGCDEGRRLAWYQTRWSWLGGLADDGHPVLGWMHPPGVDGVNEAGFRDGRPLEPGRGPRVALVGDSFAWGHDLPVEQSLGPLLRARLPGVDVVNLGVSGFAHDQMALRLEAEAAAVRPDVVVLLAVSCDVSRNASRFQVFAKPWLDGAGEVHGVPVPTRRAVAWRMLLTPRLGDLAAVWVSVLTRDEGAWRREQEQATEVALDRLARAAHAADAALVVVQAPIPADLDRRRRPGDPDDPGAVYARWCASRAATCVDLTDAVDRAVTDPEAFRLGTHWSASGTALVADGVAAALRAHPRLSVPPDPRVDE